MPASIPRSKDAASIPSPRATWIHRRIWSADCAWHGTRNNLAGYGDVLFGRGVVKYLNGGQPNASDTVLYIQNTTNVLSFGGGVDWNWTPHFGLKGDFQLQRYDSPVSTTGELYSKVFTIGLTYRLGSGSVRTRRP